MITGGDGERDLGALVVALVGSLMGTEDPFEPFRLVDPDGFVVPPVAVFLRDLQARGRSANTQRSYGLALLRWFRFLWAVHVCWEEATRVEARDFCRWIQGVDKPRRRRWRRPAGGSGSVAWSGRRAANQGGGKPSPGSRYAPAT